MIILTGASGGIGREIINNLLEVDKVIGIYNSSLPETKSTDKVIYEKVDLSKPDDINSFVNKWKDKLSNIVLVHAAAFKVDGLAANYKEGDWDSTMSVNLKGNFLLTQALLPQMMKQHWGRIIHFSSTGAIQGAVGTIAYSASKTGLIGLSRTLAKEYGRFNITSNILALGNFKIGLFNRLADSVKKIILSKIPSKACGDISNIVNAVKFLINSEYVNGATINIDGGM